MSESSQIAEKISALGTSLWMRHYTSCKLRTDPLYGGVYGELKTSALPLLDIGCGIGILAMYLRERGWSNAITGFDYDASKVRHARSMVEAGAYADIQLSQQDARRQLPEHHGDVAILDILQFFNAEEQSALLKSAAARVAPGGTLIIRSCLAQKSLRFYTTLIGDQFAKLTFWMKSAPVRYPTEYSLRSSLQAEGLEVEISPFWGKTPFSNYLILARRQG